MQSMQQVIGTAQGARLVRMPMPAIGVRDVLVRTRFSLISSGTETAAMQRGSVLPPHPDQPFILRHRPAPKPDDWEAASGCRIAKDGGLSWCRSGPEAYGYALFSPTLHLEGGTHHALSATIRIGAGNVSFGVLKADGSAWLATRFFSIPQPELTFRIDLDLPIGADELVKLVVSNHRPDRPEASHFAVTAVSHISWVPAENSPTSSEPGASRLASWMPFLKPPSHDDPPAGDVVVRGLDLPIDETQQQGWSLGYSAAGEVVAIGSAVREVGVGDLVACGGAGRANHAQYLSVPVLLTARVPAGVDARAACAATIGAIALQGLRRCKPELGQRVLIVGLGLLGQLTVQLAKAAGARVFGFDLDQARVALAKQRGLHDGASNESELARLVAHATAEQGVDAVIIAAAAKSDGPINLAMKLCRRRGRIVISGDVDIHPQRGDFYKKEIELAMATSYGPGRYDSAYEDEGRDYPYADVRWTANRNMQSFLEQLLNGSVTIEDLIGAEYPLDQAPAAYKHLIDSEPRPLTVRLAYPADNQPAPVPAAMCLSGGAKIRPGALKVVMVGAGGFAQSMLAPKLMAYPDLFQLHGIVSRDAIRGGMFARSIGIPTHGSELAPFLDNPDVDIVLIANRHREHAQYVCRALRAGKHVFVEKPLATTRDDLAAVAGAYEKLARPPHLAVGFNRRFSPSIIRLCDALADRKAPLVISYRVNAGKIPLDHWIQGQDGGGRNIGEACHMYDVFRRLAKSPVVSATASALGQRPSDMLANDHFSATMRYQDGSLATLLYTANGPKQGMPKERIEVFCDGECWVIDDFTHLARCSDGKVLWEGATDKGHAEELRLFGRAIQDGLPPTIPFGELMETSALALTIEDQLR